MVMERLTETMTEDLNNIKWLFSTSPTSFISKVFDSRSYLQETTLVRWSAFTINAFFCDFTTPTAEPFRPEIC
ncbi:hypothetical protein HanXRQr2_Chr02g0081801 [Helianthus annuus]|uniref:Uncharacterized protein n=1 Tax=Helianthus annuus TaxID=4232 RepID=A0A9K3JRB2_HELAN|nr:hypothetical protein HanXRQr2_Chr02g0081801 [Helianthus annuus]